MRFVAPGDSCHDSGTPVAPPPDSPIMTGSSWQQLEDN
jgi:hypothetical protein